MVLILDSTLVALIEASVSPVFSSLSFIREGYLKDVRRNPGCWSEMH